MTATKETVFAAADELTAAGAKVTLDAVRLRTGGSYSTLAPLIKAWRADRTSATAPMHEPAPQAVTDRLAALGAEVWAVALDLASARLTAEREALEDARTELEAERAEAVELADALAEQLDDMKSRLEGARMENQELKAHLQDANEQARISHVRAAEIERRATELRTELDRAHHEADLARAALAEERKNSQAAADRLDQVRTELARVRAKTDADREMVAAEMQRMAADQDKRDQAAREAAQAREDTSRLAGQLQAKQDEIEKLLAKLSNTASEARRNRKAVGKAQ